MAIEPLDLILVALVTSFGAGFGQELSKAVIKRLKKHYKKINGKPKLKPT